MEAAREGPAAAAAVGEEARKQQRGWRGPRDGVGGAATEARCGTEARGRFEEAPLKVRLKSV